MDKCFCHLNGYKVKDADARKSIEELSKNFSSCETNVGKLIEEMNNVNNYVTPQSFGAIGDGVEDDTEAFLSAVNECFYNDKKLLVPHGSYMLSEPIFIDSGYVFDINGEFVNYPIIISKDIDFPNNIHFEKRMLIEDLGCVKGTNWLEGLCFIKSKNVYWLSFKSNASNETTFAELDINFNFLKSFKLSCGHSNSLAYNEHKNVVYTTSLDPISVIYEINVNTYEITNSFTFNEVVNQVAYDNINRIFYCVTNGAICIVNEEKFNVIKRVPLLYDAGNNLIGQGAFIYNNELIVIFQSDANFVFVNFNYLTGSIKTYCRKDIGVKEVEDVAIVNDDIVIAGMNTSASVEVLRLSTNLYPNNSDFNKRGAVIPDNTNIVDFILQNNGKFYCESGSHGKTITGLPPKYPSCGFTLYITRNAFNYVYAFLTMNKTHHVYYGVMQCDAPETFEWIKLSDELVTDTLYFESFFTGFITTGAKTIHITVPKSRYDSRDNLKAEIIAMTIRQDGNYIFGSVESGHTTPEEINATVSVRNASDTDYQVTLSLEEAPENAVNNSLCSVFMKGSIGV